MLRVIMGLFDIGGRVGGTEGEGRGGERRMRRWSDRKELSLES